MLQKQPDHDQSWVAIDFETSGLNCKTDRVIEYAAIRIYGGNFVGELTTLIDVPCRIQTAAKRIHGINHKMLTGQPRPAQAWSDFIEFIGSSSLIAHNADFDFNFLRSELGRLGCSISNKSICTLQLARRRYPNLDNHRLETVARHVLGEIPADCRLHRALNDARLVAYLWLAQEDR